MASRPPEAIYGHLGEFRIIFQAVFYVKINSKHILLNGFCSKMPLNGRKWPRNAAAHHPARRSFYIARDREPRLSEAIYGHLGTFGIILKPLFYVQLNSKHILLNAVCSKMTPSDRKWPRKSVARDPTKKSMT